ncbi:MAG: hypothetical protein GX892_12765 [Thermoanaerobacteraceae bacterium]|nr:hypothetical protein [Thermoanaerobacteraceae bacterium]
MGHKVQMTSKLKVVFFCFLWVFLAVLQVEASEKTFRKVQLNYGVSLEIPKSWEVANKNVMSNFFTEVQNLAMGNQRYSEINLEHELLFIAFDSSKSFKAVVGVMVTSFDTDSLFTQATVAFATREELQKILDLDVLQSDQQAISDKIGTKILEIKPLRVEKINGLYSVVLEWIQVPFEGSPPSRVAQYLIPFSNRIVQFIFVNEVSPGEKYKTVLEHIKDSIMIKKDPAIWPSMHINNMGTIKYPTAMELQNDIYRETVGAKKRYVFQQKGLNEGFPISFRQYVRLIITVTKGNPGDFLRVSDIENLSDEDLKEIQAYFLEGARDQAPEIRIIDVYEPKIVTLNGKYSALLIAYKRESVVDRSLGPVLVREYCLPNWKYAYTIQASYRSAEETVWKEDLLMAVDSISLEKVY